MLKNLRGKLLSSDGKRLFNNFISLASLNIIGLLLPLITLPYVLRIIGFELYGVVVMAMSLINYFTAITDYSFKITGTRAISQHRCNTKYISLVYSKVMTVQVALLLISLFVISIIVFSFPFFREHAFVFFITTVFLIGYTLFPDWFFLGMEKMKYIMIINVIIKITSAICIFIFIKEKSDFWLYPFFQALGFLLSGIVGQYILYKSFRIKYRWIGFKRLGLTLKENYPIFINQFLPALYNNTSTFLLGLVSTTYFVGIYDAIRKVIDIGVMGINTLSNVFFPFLNRRNASFDFYKKLMIFIGICLSVLPVVFSKYIFIYLNVSAEEASVVLIILSIGLFAVTIYDIFGVNYFIVKRLDKVVMKNTLLSSIVGLLLAFPLVKLFGIYGAALNLTICRLIMGLGLYLRYRTYLKIK